MARLPRLCPAGLPQPIKSNGTDLFNKFFKGDFFGFVSKKMDLLRLFRKECLHKNRPE